MDTKHATIFKPFHVATTTSALQHYTVVRTRGEGVLLHTYQDGQIQHPTKKNVLQASTLFMYYFDDQSKWRDGH